MILSTYTQFREVFTRRISISATVTFADVNPDTITRAAGDYGTDGVEDGMSIWHSGTVNNNAILYKINTVSGAVLTLDAGESVVAEGPVASTAEAYHVDPDGWPRFPGPFDSTNLVRSGGFDGGITGAPNPYLGAAFNLTVNDGAADSATGVDEYDWYVSQRTDDSAKQLWTVTPLAAGADSFSGSIQMVHSALATSELGVAIGPLPAQQYNGMLRNMAVYCRRISDGAIQWLDLLRAMTVD